MLKSSDLFLSHAVEKALLDAKFDKTQIHDIVLVVGSSRIPKIQELLQGFFDGKKLIKSLNPDEAVAYGAAVQAAILSGDRSEEVQDMLLLPITSFSLGIETGGGVMTSVIRRNSTIPKKESFSIQCPGDNHSVTVRIFEGERAMVKDNNFLDEVHLKLTPRPKEAGDHQIEIVFDVWRSEKLDVSIRDRITGEEKTITVTSSKNRLSADDIDRMKEEAENSKCKGIAASTGPPGEEDVSHPLGVGSLIQLPGADGCSVYYGTIKWIGLVPNAQGKIAGIELEEPLDGCTDGTFQATGQKFFNCPCGKGLYYPLQNIKPDQRCQHDTPVDLSVHSEPPPDEGSQDEISCANRDQLGDDPRPQDSERASEGAEMLGLKDLLNLKLIHDCNELQAKTVILQADKDGLVKEKNELLDQVGKLTETSQVRESEVQKLKKALEASRARVQELTDQARDVEATIQAQEVEIERKATVIASKDETIREKEDEIAELQNQLDVERQKAIFNQPSNRSWKVSRSEIQRIPKRQIGFGAWGAVYSAKFQGKDVAIKIAHHQILHHTTIDMLKREVTIMSHLQHPNLVRFIAAVWDDAVERQQDMPIIVSELMEMNLRAAYERKIDLSNSMVSIFRDVAYALHYLHQHREPIIHRDISAPNVLLKSLPGGSYRAKVSDFGSANLVKQSKTAGAGAIVYCAPEMFPNEDISVPPQPQTTKVDVFSYGILLLEVISKEMPTQETRYALLQKLKKKWDVMYALLVHCTKPSPSDRPAMADILNQLNSMPN